MSDDNLNQDNNQLGKKAVRLMKLGKAPAKFSVRTFKAEFKTGLPSPPESYNFYDAHPEIPKRMWLNNLYGICVCAAAANYITGAEVLEQGVVVPITDQELLNIYLRLSPSDNGLVILDFLEYWRKNGLDVGGHNYKIGGYATINWKDTDQIKRAIIANVGLMFGLALPVDVADQFQRGVPWDVTDGPGGVPGTWGGHGVLAPGYASGKVIGYNKDGIQVDSWAERVFVTWDLVRKIGDEAYVIRDEHNDWHPDIIVTRPQTDEDHSSQPGAIIALGVKIGWDRQQVSEYFLDLSPVAGTMQPGEADWRVGADKYHVEYDADGLVNGVTRTMGAYNTDGD